MTNKFIFLRQTHITQLCGGCERLFDLIEVEGEQLAVCPFCGETDDIFLRALPPFTYERAAVLTLEQIKTHRHFKKWYGVIINHIDQKE